MESLEHIKYTGIIKQQKSNDTVGYNTLVTKKWLSNITKLVWV